MNGALIFSHRDIFDVVRAVFSSPVSSFQREDAQRRERWWQADWSRRSGPTHAIRLWLDSLGGSQTRGSHPGQSEEPLSSDDTRIRTNVHTPMPSLRSLRVLLWEAQ